MDNGFFVEIETGRSHCNGQFRSGYRAGRCVSIAVCVWAELENSLLCIDIIADSQRCRDDALVLRASGWTLRILSQNISLRLYMTSLVLGAGRRAAALEDLMETTAQRDGFAVLVSPTSLLADITSLAQRSRFGSDTDAKGRPLIATVSLPLEMIGFAMPFHGMDDSIPIYGEPATIRA